MGIQVEGSNNRVAGRDYYENQIKPCPRCEVRVIDRDRSMCNHCTKEEKELEARGLMLIFGLGGLFIFGWLYKWRTEHGLPPGIDGLVETFMLSIGITVAVALTIWLLVPLILEIGAAYLDERRRQ